MVGCEVGGRRWFREGVMKSSYRFIHVVLALVIGSCALSQAATYYVSPDGDNTTGQSWASAFTRIQEAVDRALSTPPDTIRVKQGTYTISTPIVINKRVLLYGGYSGDGDARNSVVYITKVDGAQAVIHCFQVTANATIDGFYITGGSAWGSAPNSQGGGMYIDQCDPVIFGCTFESNQSESVGAGVYGRFFDGCISDCSFVQNVTSADGAGIYLASSNATITDCIFTGNRGEKWLTTRGGAIYNQSSSPAISACVFSGNAASEGAGIFNDNSDASIVDCEFAGCDLSSGRGGGIYNDQSATIIKNCLFYGNKVGISGAAIYEAESCSSSIVNCVIRNNEAVAQGGAIYTGNNTVSLFTNCTIYGNSVGGSGGGAFNSFGRPTFTNCILWDNSAAMGGPGIRNESDQVGMAAIVRYCDVQGSTVYPGTGNIVGDPKFVNPAADDLHLLTGSPCIDAGTNGITNIEVVDFEGHPRIVDGNLDGTSVVDMGAYENQKGLQVKDHLYEVYISQGALYSSPSAASPGYHFVFQAQTDDSVDHVEFLAPSGYVYKIANTPFVSSGDVQTTHQVNGAMHTWQYWGRYADASALSYFGDGGYLVIVYYKNGSSQQTNVYYSLPNSYSAIPAPTQKPSLTSPSDQEQVVSPVSFAWSACTDSSVTTISLIIVDADSGAAVETASFGPGETASDAFSLDEGQYQVELAFQSSYDVINQDGVPFRYGKSIVVCSQFEVFCATIYRFWAPTTGQHFYTISPSERDTLASTYWYFWQYEGVAFKACVTEYQPGLSPVYRFWSPVSSCHFYTISEEEKDYLIANFSYFWTYEGIAFYAFPEGAQPAGTAPVYRFWSPISSTHFYTISADEKDWLIANHSYFWTYEGIGFYTFP
jgi:hypothetical protein